MRILALETSCDDLSWSVVEDGKHVLALTISSQVDIHAKTGGVVPEVAAREHAVTAIPALDTIAKDVDLKTIDAVAVTVGPGLLGSLLVGINTASTLATLLHKPLIPVHHIEGHIYANWLERDAAISFPSLILTVSGGHNDMYLMKDHFSFVHVGTTLDDAAGEAFDKVARMLDLGYPGGPAIEKLAYAYPDLTSDLVFPIAWGNKDEGTFSFSGLKSEVRRTVEKYKTQGELTELQKAEIAHAFLRSVTEVLSKKAFRMAKKHNAKSVCVTGGVSASTPLVDAMKELSSKENIAFFHPVKKLYSTDNAAMIGAAAYYKVQKFPDYLSSFTPLLTPHLSYTLGGEADNA